jgi:glycogen(starch) synthase
MPAMARRQTKKPARAKSSRPSGPAAGSSRNGKPVDGASRASVGQNRKSNPPQQSPAAKKRPASSGALRAAVEPLHAPAPATGSPAFVPSPPVTPAPPTTEDLASPQPQPQPHAQPSADNARPSIHSERLSPADDLSRTQASADAATTEPPPQAAPIAPHGAAGQAPAVGTPFFQSPAREAPIPPAAPLLFEIAWEVCWQLGGIYTVLRSKAAAMVQRWEDRYCLIGPYNPATAAVDFEERPTEGIIRQALDKLRAAGIPCHYGRWLIPGRPRVILLDYRARFSSLDADKYLIWKDHGIGTNAGDGEVNEVVAFGFTVAEFFRELCSVVTDRPILAHFHEWMAGLAVPRLAHMRLPVTTVFTTHATLLGRYLAGDNPYFYEHLPFLNGDAEAAKYQILPRHLIEKSAAHASTVFTTVSEVTAREAQQLLGRNPEVVLPNGLNIQRFAALHEFQNLHQRYKERIHEFVMGHFFPSYTFDLERTIYVFTSGRYEYRNKGIDLFIEALHRVNERLRHVQDRPTIVAFIVTRAATRNINVGTLQGQAMFDDLKNTCQEIEASMGRRLFLAATTGRLPSYNELLPEDASVRLKRAMHVWRSSRQPAIVTHDLADDAGDPILRHLRHRKLFNAPDDAVKMVFHPEFLTATSPLLSLDYDNFVRGCHLGVFPSYYEPWGYTPMESIALGVPAVTTDLSGFGAYVERHIDRSEEQGVLVLHRRDKSFEDSAEHLARYIADFAQLTRRQRIELRNRVERLSELFDWSVLIRHYTEAHDLALERTAGGRPGRLEIRVV